MKYRIGNLVSIQSINYIMRPHNFSEDNQSSIVLYLLKQKGSSKNKALPKAFTDYKLEGSLGIITKNVEAVKLAKLIKATTFLEDDNGYCLLSQANGQEYYFYEDQLNLNIL